MPPVRSPRVLSTCTLFSFLFCQPLLAQATWTKLAPTTLPTQRTEVVMASDGTGALVYGGIILNNVYVGDIWRFDGKNWTDLKPATPVPPIRGRLAGDWDLVRSRLVIFGGQGTTGTLGDTWEYDKATNKWSNPKPTVAPSARAHARMAYELKGLRMILFGGARTAETWSWNGLKWTNLTATVTKSPSGRDQVNMATNQRTGEIVLFGGTTNGGNTGIIGDTWIWNGKDWRQVVTKTTPGGSGIRNGKLTYDEVRDRIVLYGGFKGAGGFSDSVWEFDGTDWTERLPTTRPVARAGMGFAFVKSLGTTIMFSGYPYPAQNETWSYQTSNVAKYEAGGVGCAGAAGTPALTGTPPWLGDTLTLTVRNVPASGPTFLFIGLSNTKSGTITLPLNLGFMNAPKCSLLVDPVLQFSMPTSLGVATFSAPLPTTAALAGVVFYNQSYAADKTANAAGIVVSNYGKGTAGLR